MSRKKSGKYVQHEDGRKGIVYHHEQDNDRIFKEESVIVRFDEDKETRKKVKINKLKVIGFVN